MFCTDPTLTLLAKYGYNVVRLPRTGIEPLNVLGREDKGIELLGTLPTIWKSTKPLPPVQNDGVAAEIKSMTTSDLKLSVGLRVLEQMLSGLGASIPKVDFAYTKKRTLRFSFGNIKVAKVEPFELGQFMTAGDLESDNPWVSRYFLEEDSDAYVITEVLKSDSVTVSTDNSDGASVGIDIKAIQDAVGADVKIEAGGTSLTDITYKGKEALTFGFKAYSIEYEDGLWRVAGVDSGEVYLSASETSTQPALLSKQGDRTRRLNIRSRE